MSMYRSGATRTVTHPISDQPVILHQMIQKETLNFTTETSSFTVYAESIGGWVAESVQLDESSYIGPSVTLLGSGLGFTSHIRHSVLHTQEESVLASQLYVEDTQIWNITRLTTHGPLTLRQVEATRPDESSWARSALPAPLCIDIETNHLLTITDTGLAGHQVRIQNLSGPGVIALSLLTDIDVLNPNIHNSTLEHVQITHEANFDSVTLSGVTWSLSGDYCDITMPTSRFHVPGDYTYLVVEPGDFISLEHPHKEHPTLTSITRTEDYPARDIYYEDHIITDDEFSALPAVAQTLLLNDKD